MFCFCLQIEFQPLETIINSTPGSRAMIWLGIFMWITRSATEELRRRKRPEVIKKERNNAIAVGCNGYEQPIFVVWNARQSPVEWIWWWSEWKWWTKIGQKGKSRHDAFFRMERWPLCTLQISMEHTDYIQKERITRAAPPKPAYNPMQFVAIKPSNLFQSAQEQLKKAEEVRKVKEVSRKEEPEDWQNVSRACQQVKVFSRTIELERK